MTARKICSGIRHCRRTVLLQRQFLISLPAAGWSYRRLDPFGWFGNLPCDRVLSAIGTNAKDYDVALGLSAKAMGIK